METITLDIFRKDNTSTPGLRLLSFVEAHSAKTDPCLRPPIYETLYPKEISFYVSSTRY